MIIIEAARWAPSASNQQPWRFLYAKRGSADWPRFLEPLSPGNQGWVAGTAVLIAVVSKRTRQPSATKSSPSKDAGQVTQQGAALDFRVPRRHIGAFPHNPQCP